LRQLGSEARPEMIGTANWNASSTPFG